MSKEQDVKYKVEGEHHLVNRHPHTSHCLVFARMFNCVARDTGSSVCARHLIHVSCACVSDLSSTLHFALFTVSLIFYFILLIFIFIFYVGRFGENSLCASANEESDSLVNNALSHKVHVQDQESSVLIRSEGCGHRSSGSTAAWARYGVLLIAEQRCNRAV